MHRPLPIDYPAGGQIECDHAIFTSARSATGEGYRIIAASPGVRRDERTEITRRSPSHGAMCSDNAEATAMLAYPLSSGRYCVSLCRYAGTEHTARGGMRVHTHAVILDPQQFEPFGFNAVRVLIGIARAVDSPSTVPQPSLPLLVLSTPADRCRPILAPGARHSAASIHLLRCLLQSVPDVVSGIDEPLVLLEPAIDAMPKRVRLTRALAADLTYATSRQASLTLVDSIHPEATRSLRGRNVRCYEIDHAPDIELHGFGPWLDLVARRADQNRWADVAQLTLRMPDDAGAREFSRSAQLILDLDRLIGADEPARDDIRQEYANFVAENPIEIETLQRIRDQLAEQPATDANNPTNACA